jgi:hypothetical protein
MQIAFGRERFLRRPNISHLAKCRGSEVLDEKVLGNQNNTEIAMMTILGKRSHTAREYTSFKRSSRIDRVDPARFQNFRAEPCEPGRSLTLPTAAGARHSVRCNTRLFHGENQTVQRVSSFCRKHIQNADFPDR